MRYPVRLFLGNEEVEFNTPPEILFNYSETELTNPSIVKNCYSKTITIEGTAQNNRIFGHIYNLERIQGYNGSAMGSSFNPLVKTDFTLYYNGSIYESGYFKLDEVRKNNNSVEYDISLFGGLGDWLYSLSYRQDGNPMELSDLTFDYERDSGGSLGFTINKETVAEAWNYIGQYNQGKWGIINFAPCYNGIPENDFAADTFLINQSGISAFGQTGTLINRPKYSVGKAENDFTEWETFDLRSYLQRPVLRVREVIKACCNPLNNGGYTVNLDSDFFNNENYYYENAWMTLPLLTELDVPATVESALTVSAITKEAGHLYRVYDDMGNVSNVSFEMQVKFIPYGDYSGNTVVLMREYDASGGITLQQRFVKKMSVDSFIMVQMLGYDSSGSITARSNMFRLIGQRPSSFYWNTSANQAEKIFEEMGPKEDVPAVTTLVGQFTRKNGEYIFCDPSGNEYILNFTFPYDAEFTELKLKIASYSRSYIKHTNGGSTMTYSGETEYPPIWSSYSYKSNTWQTTTTVESMARVYGSFSYVPYGATGITESFEGFWTGRNFTKKDLLTLGASPAQFLLSYAKLFNLYFVKNPENKTIDILTRHNFYLRDKVVNINDLVDKGSDMTITPVTPKYQYYDFVTEQVDSEAAKSYKNTYGNDYGTASVNTGYEFAEERKSVLDGNIFKGGIDVLEKNKYFRAPINGVPCLTRNGFDYWYYATNSGVTNISYDEQPMTGATINPDGLECYDAFPKPQFHTEENKASDGSMVLLFLDPKNYYHFVGSIGYMLTDDIQEMYTLNDGQPCWLMSRYEKDRAGKSVALTVASLPVFNRAIYTAYNYIRDSFDMGAPLTTYVPNKYVTDWMSIYSKGWKSYIGDLYNVNSRILKCRCLLRERPNPEWLRRFYWFDNSYWRLNNIKDWNVSSFDETEMEFIKVQDINDYDNIAFSKHPLIELRLNAYTVGYTGGTLTGTIYVSDGSGFATPAWWYAEYNGGTAQLPPSRYLSPISSNGGATETPVTFTFTERDVARSTIIDVVILDIFNGEHHFEVTQEGHIAGPNASITPSAQTVGYEDMAAYVYIQDPYYHRWELSTQESWIQPEENEGEGTTTLAIYCDLNEQPYDRMATLYIRDKVTTSIKTATITQQGAPPQYDSIYIEFIPGSFISYNHDDYDIMWKVYKGVNRSGTLLFEGELGGNCRLGETYIWGDDTFEDEIYSVDFGEEQFYYWEIRITDSSTHSYILWNDSGIISVDVPDEPDGMYYYADLPDVTEY